LEYQQRVKGDVVETNANVISRYTRESSKLYFHWKAKLAVEEGNVKGELLDKQYEWTWSIQKSETTHILRLFVFSDRGKGSDRHVQ
jgi:hypothetical protein